MQNRSSLLKRARSFNLPQATAISYKLYNKIVFFFFLFYLH